MLSRGVISLCRIALKPAKLSSVMKCGQNTNLRAFHASLPKMTTYFTEDHEWITVENNVGTVGITNFAQEQLGDIVFCELPDVGTTFEKGDAIAVVESVKAASDLYSPVSGEIVDTNTIAVDHTNLISTSPTEEGWLVRMELSNTAELEDLMNAEQYAKYTEE